MPTAYEKMSTLLKELFQLDQADLDFGIYRIMNQKRGEITRFLDHELLPQVKAAFDQYRPADKKVIEGELQKAIQGAQALGVDPDLVPKVKEIREQLATYAVDTGALENEVYSHLFSFFRRYYDNGDFISMRRYKEGVYAIPYEGEEVKLHWANADQYYVKTTENFRDYAFRLPSGRLAHFKIVEAETEKDNRKAADDKERRFLLAAENSVTVEGDTLVMRFEYRADPEKREQKALNAQAIESICAAAPADWSAELRTLAPSESNPRRTLLEKHMADYTTRNTFDYFIHKDLRGFLRRELDFYIKNEVMRLDDIEDENAPRVEQYLSKIKVIRAIAHKIIEFLAQIEDFQKKLWLKKKFVVETNYCITLDRVPEELYPTICANDAQREEWVRLFSINEIKSDLITVGYSSPLTVDFLKAHPLLVLDTKFFDSSFINKLLSSLEDLDHQMDGLLVFSENSHALNLLRRKYEGKVVCIHIDPPYNTQTSGFLYKNNYQHSSWLSMMENKISASVRLLSSEGSFLCHIDENEYEHLHLLFNSFPVPNAGTVAWDKRNPMNAGRGIATQHEYVIWRSNKETPIYLRNKSIQEMLKVASEIIKKHGGVTEAAQKEYASWVNSNEKLSGGEKAYRYLDNQGNIYQSVSLRAPEPRTDPKFHKPLIHPVTRKPCPVPPNGFSRTPETLQTMVENGEILFGADETTQPRHKKLLTDETMRQVSSLMQDGKKGKADVAPMGLDFPYCHPVSLYEELIGSVAKTRGDVVLDYFAGSGTTGHAVINLCRDDGVNRKYILVEMGNYFNDVTKPRIQKVIYSKEWADGKPVSREGSSHCFKYLRLESFEDALNNLGLSRTKEQQLALEANPEFRENYLLSYMLSTESQGSLLNIQSFVHPFDYQLNIATGAVGESKPTKIDLVETFNYLIGLRVETMQTIRGFRVITGRTPANDRTLVIWRDMEEKSNADLETFFQKQDYNPRDMEFDLIYVNGDNNLENLRRPDETWKVRLIEEDFLRLMFDTETF